MTNNQKNIELMQAVYKENFETVNILYYFH